MKKSLLLSFLLLCIGYLLFPTPSFAQSTSTSHNYYNTNPDVPKNLNTHVQSLIVSFASATSCILTGFDPVDPEAPCLGIDPATKKIGYVENSGGLLSLTGDLIASTFYIPASSIDYGHYIAANFGIAKSTYAQNNPPPDSPISGIGFSALRPTLELWEAFRNITYMIFVVLFIVIGLGIMFRVKIDPRTVMTIQNQIPKIIVALILVTFSYAIAGFLVDMMYIFMYLIISIFASQNLETVNVFASTPFGAIGGMGGIMGIANGASGSLAGLIAAVFDGTLGNIVGGIIGGLVGGFIGGSLGPFGKIAGPLIGGGGGALLGFAFGNEIVGLLARVIAYLVIVIALVSALLRLWFVLIKSYIYILLNTVLAPFFIAKGLIPGQSGVGAWLKSMIANLSVFPVTVIMMLLGKAFMDGFTSSPLETFVPPFVGNFSNPSAFASIIGLAIILMLPEVANMIKEALKSPDFKFTTSIGRSLGAGAGIPASIGKSVGSKFWGINPYTNEPRYLTKAFVNRFGRGTGIFSKALRGITGTGKWHAESKLGIQQAANAQRNAFNLGRRATRPEFNDPDADTPTQGPEMAPGFKPPKNWVPPNRDEDGGDADGGAPHTPGPGTPPGGPGTPPAGGPSPDAPEAPTPEDSPDSPDSPPPAPLPHGEAIQEDHEAEEAPEERRQERQAGGGNENKTDNKEILNKLEEVNKGLGNIKREQTEAQKENREGIAKLDEDVKKTNNS